MHLIKTISSDRRSILKGLAAAAVAPLAAPAFAAEALPAQLTGWAAAIATEKAYWTAVKGLYAVTPDVVNLENGFWGIMAEPVRREFIRGMGKVAGRFVILLEPDRALDVEDPAGWAGSAAPALAG